MQQYHYFRKGPRLEFYTEIYDFSEQHTTGLLGVQPPFIRDLIPVLEKGVVDFAEGDPDILGFTVNTPAGDTLGTIVGYLVDSAQSVVPYAYVKVRDGKTVVVPTTMFMIYPDVKLVTLEGGIKTLSNAPDALMDKTDAERADRYWGDFRRDQAA